uniref:Non-selective voltage-gated ion channel VDAC1 n=1 Tax=Sus scrofa TaxID=9823 RepID=A0A8D0WJF4_PIG
MAVPSVYADLGKSARDVFTKGYGFGLIKLDLRSSRRGNGLEFTSSGSANPETTRVMGSLETKYRWTEYGTEITLEDQLDWSITHKRILYNRLILNYFAA